MPCRLSFSPPSGQPFRACNASRAQACVASVYFRGRLYSPLVRLILPLQHPCPLRRDLILTVSCIHIPDLDYHDISPKLYSAYYVRPHLLAHFDSRRWSRLQASNSFIVRPFRHHGRSGCTIVSSSKTLRPRAHRDYKKLQETSTGTACCTTCGRGK